MIYPGIGPALTQEQKNDNRLPEDEILSVVGPSEVEVFHLFSKEGLAEVVFWLRVSWWQIPIKALKKIRKMSA